MKQFVMLGMMALMLFLSACNDQKSGKDGSGNTQQEQEGMDNSKNTSSPTN